MLSQDIRNLQVYLTFQNSHQHSQRKINKNPSGGGSYMDATFLK